LSLQEILLISYIFIKDYNLEENEDDVLENVLDNREAIHSSWVSLFLGFDTLGLYGRSNVMLALVL
jgi:hypothetical protein